jgi:cell division protein ZapA|tara:strand:- start:38365 stop:38679 length:315 start_codon:yes stop_codon:yes gene_type:complete
MPSDAQTVTITLMDKQYQINCDPQEREELLESARMLNQNMLEIRQSGGVIGLERIAIIAGLNVAHEMVKSQNSGATSELVSSGIERLRDKIDSAIQTLSSPLSR